MRIEMLRTTGGPAGSTLLAGAVLVVGEDVDADVARSLVISGRAVSLESEPDADAAIVAAPAVVDGRARKR